VYQNLVKSNSWTTRWVQQTNSCIGEYWCANWRWT